MPEQPPPPGQPPSNLIGEAVAHVLGDPSARQPKENVKETVISILIAFAMAFIFRSFVAEAFIIPTGSMAPTLNGAHMRFQSDLTGQDWAVGPWWHINGDSQMPYPRQADAPMQGGKPIVVSDPLTGGTIVDRAGEIRAGDRIFVLKYLYGLREPQPFDVVVFKNPTRPDENYIKRLIARPGEQVALVDGDVFIRDAALPVDPSRNMWEQEGWTIRRKPERVQKAVWQPVYDSGLVTPAGLAAGLAQPLAPSAASLAAKEGGRWFGFDGSAPATLRFDTTKRHFSAGVIESNPFRAINDRYAYNDQSTFSRAPERFPVGDMRIRFALKLGGPNPSALQVAPVITACGHEFRALLTDRKAELAMRPAGAAPGAWTVLTTAALPAFVAGDVLDVEFWHADQGLTLLVDGRAVAAAGYAWTPAQRLRNAIDTPVDVFTYAEDVLKKQPPGAVQNPFAQTGLYRQAAASIELAGAAAELHRVGIDRDLFYTPAAHRNELGAGTYPSRTFALAQDQFFVCGDNSPASLDARLWGASSPWVRAEIDPTPNIVPRRLLMGKAFFVYFPAPVKFPVPDFGRMRFIQ